MARSKKLPLVYIVAQEGGSSGEMYVHAFDSELDALKYRLECERAAYRTTPPVPMDSGAITPHIMDVIGELLSAVANSLDYP